MDDLRATYPDEEEEDTDSLYTPLKAPFPVSNGLNHDTTEDDEDDDDDPAPTSAAATLPPGGDSPVVPEPEPEPGQPAAKPENPVADEEGEEEEEDEDEDDGSAAPAHKKQKSLSEFASPSPQPAEAAAAAAAAAAKPSKKSKKKSNNVWTKSTSRKGKKKAKAPTPSQEDAVLITPVPRFPDKSDDSADSAVCLSKVYKAEKVELSDDRLSAGSSKGYRMVRATRGVQDGAWYFEIKVVKLGPTGHTRLGWSMEKGDLQAPVGYDGNSFGYRDLEGSKVHKAVRERYGEGYGEGDVVGFYISLPDGDSYAPKPPQFVWYKGQSYAYPADGKDEPPKVVPGSEITFFKNGVCQGVAFSDLFGGRYYPAASMFTSPNQPNCWVKFNFGPDFEFFPQDFGERPIPKPMSEAPYHGFYGRDSGTTTENGVAPEQKQ